MDVSAFSRTGRPLSLLAAALLLSACADDPASSGSAEFAHGSPRPPCRVAVDSTRSAWFEAPVVVVAGWSDPVKLAAPLNTPCPEDAIEIAPDGSALYFFWSPVVNGSAADLLHITTGTYRAERTGADPGVFSEPCFYDLQKGAPGGSVDGEPSFTAAGDSVYFHSTRSANLGYLMSPPVDDPMDIYVAAVVGGEPGPAANLGRPVNSEFREGEHALGPDGRLYLSSTRPGGLGGVDIWISTRQGGAWSEPVNPGAPINSPGEDLQPAFAANDPLTMYFTSDRDGPSSIYRSRFNGSAWGLPEMMITGYVGEASLVGDGSLLYFVHVLVDAEGVFGADVWYLRRVEGE